MNMLRKGCWAYLVPIILGSMVLLSGAWAAKGGGGKPGSGKPGGGNSLQATRVTGDVLVAPSDTLWDSATPVTYSMRFVDDIETAAPGAASLTMTVKAIHNGADIAFLLTWADPTMNADEIETDAFADRGSVMLNANSICHMGSETNPTNMWFWHAASNSVQNLLAGGLGTITHTPDDNVSVISDWSNGEWQVVMHRSLNVLNPDNEYPLSAGGSYDVSFAAWDGDNNQRNGRKWISGIEKLSIQN